MIDDIIQLQACMGPVPRVLIIMPPVQQFYLYKLNF